MRKSKVGSLITACIMIMLSATMIVCGTYALWSDKVEVFNHLEAGTLKVNLERTYLKKHTLDDDGYMTDSANSQTVDFTTATSANVFDLTEDEYVVPTSYYEARLVLTNVGNVAFDYAIQITTNGSSAEELAKQVKVYVGSGEIENVTYDAGRYLASESEGNLQYLTTYEIASGFMDATQNRKEFWIKIEFENRGDNDDAQSKEASFDLLITATQKTSRTGE